MLSQSSGFNGPWNLEIPMLVKIDLLVVEGEKATIKIEYHNLDLLTGSGGYFEIPRYSQSSHASLTTIQLVIADARVQHSSQVTWEEWGKS